MPKPLFVRGVLPKLRITIGLVGCVLPTCRPCLPNTVPICLHEALVSTILFICRALPDISMAVIQL